MPSGGHRPAIIVRVDSDVVAMVVFTDGDKDGYGPRWEQLVMHDEGGRRNTWHWPEREDEKPAAQTISEAGGIDAREGAVVKTAPNTHPADGGPQEIAWEEPIVVRD
jgi:hypothetical protein